MNEISELEEQGLLDQLEEIDSETVDENEIVDLPRAFPKEELAEVHDRLKALDESALALWSEYFLPIAAFSAGKAMAEVREGQWHPGLFDELRNIGWACAMYEGKKLMAKPGFVMDFPEHYIWKSIKNAIRHFLMKENRFLDNHKSTNYKGSKGSFATVAATEPGYGLNWNQLLKDSEGDFERSVIEALKKNCGNVQQAAKAVGRPSHIIRSVIHQVEERSLNRQRKLFKIVKRERIAPESIDSIPKMMRELDALEAHCKTAFEGSVLALMVEHCDASIAAATLGVTKESVNNALGAIAGAYAKQSRADGKPLPWLENRAKTLKASRPRRKQADNWRRESPLSSAEKRSRQSV